MGSLKRNLPVPIISPAEFFENVCRTQGVQFFCSVFILVNKTSVCWKLALQEFDSRSSCTIWVTNGMANSSSHLLCTLIMSWFAGSHRPFQTLTDFPSLTFWRGQRRLACPLFYRWENRDLKRMDELPTKVTQQAEVLPNLLLLVVGSLERIQGNSSRISDCWPKTSSILNFIFLYISNKT